MFRIKVYGNNPTHQVVLGFDDTLRSFFATVIDLDLHLRLFDVGTAASPIRSLTDFQITIGQYLTISQDMYLKLSIAANHTLPHFYQSPTAFPP